MNAENDNEYNVCVKLDDQNMYNYYFEKSYPNRLVKFYKNKVLFSKAL